MNLDSKSKLSRKEREYQLRRQVILSASMRLFATKGYHGTTMSEIAKEAEFSTGSLYNFFKNKEELYFTILKEHIDFLEKKLREDRARPGTVFELLERTVSNILDYCETNRDFFRILATHRETFEWKSKGEFSDVIHEKYLAFISEIVFIFRQGIEQGEFKSFKPEELGLVFISIVNSFIFLWANSEEEYLLTDNRDAILDLFYNGACKGEKKLQ